MVEKSSDATEDEIAALSDDSIQTLALQETRKIKKKIYFKMALTSLSFIGILKSKFEVDEEK